MICYYPGFIHHIYTNNENRLDGYWANRRRHYKERYRTPEGEVRKPLFHTLARWETEHIRWPVTGNSTSSLAACHVGVYLGYDDILLCGCPMDDTGHFWEAPWERMPKGREFSSQFRGGRQVWAYARDKVFKGKVKSVSGRTKDILDGIPCW